MFYHTVHSQETPFLSPFTRSLSSPLPDSSSSSISTTINSLYIYLYIVPVSQEQTFASWIPSILFCSCTNPYCFHLPLGLSEGLAQVCVRVVGGLLGKAPLGSQYRNTTCFFACHVAILPCLLCSSQTASKVYSKMWLSYKIYAFFPYHFLHSFV